MVGTTEGVSATSPKKETDLTESTEGNSKKRNKEEIARCATDDTGKEGDDVKASTDATTTANAEKDTKQDAEKTAAAAAATESADPSPPTTTAAETDTAQAKSKTAAAATTDSSSTNAPSPPKKAKIAMPPAVSAMLTDVDEYKLDAPPTSDNTDDSKIESPNIILFGLHPLVKESPLKKMCEHYGTVKTIGVRSAFASRYGHVEYATVEEAKKAYKALNGATLMQKEMLVQPTKGQSQTAK